MAQIYEERLPLSSITRLSPLNPRQDMESDVSMLVATIGLHGLLHPLLVQARPDHGSGEYEVLAGGRRWRALRRCCGVDWVAVRIFDGAPGEAREAAIAESVTQKPLHPVEEFEAFRDLADGGFDVAAIARDFALTEKHVRQRLALGRLSPRVLALWRAGAINRDAAEAFTAGTIAAQEALLDEWGGAPASSVTGHHIRKAMRREAVEGTEPVAKFLLADPARIGAYRAQGGRLEESLFSEETILLDRGVAQQVARLALLAAAEAVAEEEGFGAAMAWDAACGDPLDVDGDYLAEEEERLDAIRRERAHPDCDEAHRSELSSEEAAIWRRAELRAVSKDQRAGLGVAADLDLNGEIEIIRFVPLTAEREADEAAAGEGEDEKTPDPKPASARSAPREKTTREPKAPEPPALLPARITREAEVILAEAAQTALEDVVSRNAGLALALAVAALGCSYGRGAVGLTCDSFTKTPRRAELLRAIEHERFEKALAVCAEAPLADLTVCFCELVAKTIEIAPKSFEGATALLGVAARLCDIEGALARGFDYRGYFEGNGRDVAIEALRALAGDAEANAAGKLKKPELVARAARLAQDRRWLPEALTAPIAGPAARDERSTAQAMREAIEADETAPAGDAETTADAATFEPHSERVRQFLAARCRRDVEGSRIKASALFAQFQSYEAGKGFPAMRLQTFAAAIAELGVTKTRISDGVHYLGLELRDDAAGENGEGR